MSVDILELDLSSPNVIPDEVIPNLNMLRLEVLHRVERNLDALSLSHQRGMIRLRRIYNFLLFHANIIQLSYTFGNFLYYFWD